MEGRRPFQRPAPARTRRPGAVLPQRLGRHAPRRGELLRYPLRAGPYESAEGGPGCFLEGAVGGRTASIARRRVSSMRPLLRGNGAKKIPFRLITARVLVGNAGSCLAARDRDGV